MMEASDLLAAPFTVAGFEITGGMIADAIDLLANQPRRFRTSALKPAFFKQGEPFPYARDEAVNRLMQRWRKMGLASFDRGYWTLSRDAWDKMQAQAIEVRTIGEP